MSQSKRGMWPRKNCIVMQNFVPTSLFLLITGSIVAYATQNCDPQVNSLFLGDHSNAQAFFKCKRSVEYPWAGKWERHFCPNDMHFVFATQQCKMNELPPNVVRESNDLLHIAILNGSCASGEICLGGTVCDPVRRLCLCPYGKIANLESLSCEEPQQQQKRTPQTLQPYSSLQQGTGGYLPQTLPSVDKQSNLGSQQQLGGYGGQLPYPAPYSSSTVMTPTAYAFLTVTPSANTSPSAYYYLKSMLQELAAKSPRQQIRKLIAGLYMMGNSSSSTAAASGTARGLVQREVYAAPGSNCMNGERCAGGSICVRDVGLCLCPGEQENQGGRCTVFHTLMPSSFSTTPTPTYPQPPEANTRIAPQPQQPLLLATLWPSPTVGSGTSMGASGGGGIKSPSQPPCSPQQQQIPCIFSGCLPCPWPGAVRESGPLPQSPLSSQFGATPQPPAPLPPPQPPQETLILRIPKPKRESGPGELCNDGQSCVRGSVCNRQIPICVCAPDTTLVGGWCLPIQLLQQQRAAAASDELRREQQQNSILGTEEEEEQAPSGDKSIEPPEPLPSSETVDEFPPSGYRLPPPPELYPKKDKFDLSGKKGGSAVGQQCALNKDCGPGAYCNGNTQPPSCQCLSTHVPVSGRCEKIIYPGQIGCENDVQCTAGFSGTKCINRLCVCPPRARAVDQTCLPDVALPGERCNISQLVPVCAPYSYCFNGHCVCVPPLTLFNKRCILSGPIQRKANNKKKHNKRIKAFFPRVGEGMDGSFERSSPPLFLLKKPEIAAGTSSFEEVEPMRKMAQVESEPMRNPPSSGMMNIPLMEEPLEQDKIETISGTDGSVIIEETSFSPSMFPSEKNRIGKTTTIEISTTGALITDLPPIPGGNETTTVIGIENGTETEKAKENQSIKVEQPAETKKSFKSVCSSNEDCPLTFLCLEKMCECPPGQTLMQGKCVELQQNSVVQPKEQVASAIAEKSLELFEKSLNDATIDGEGQREEGLVGKLVKSPIEEMFATLSIFRKGFGFGNKIVNNTGKNESQIVFQASKDENDDENLLGLSSLYLGELETELEVENEIINEPTEAATESLRKRPKSEEEFHFLQKIKKPEKLTKTHDADFMLLRRRRRKREPQPQKQQSSVVRQSNIGSEGPTAGIRQIAEPCRPGDVCLNGTACFDGVCNCPKGFQFQNNTCQSQSTGAKETPQAIYSSLGGICSSTDRCSGGSACLNSTCQCTDGSMPGDNSRCIQMPGGKCTLGQYCSGGSKCLNGICQCASGRRLYRQKCVLSVAYPGDSCLSGERCFNGSVCRFGRCLCPPEHTVVEKRCQRGIPVEVPQKSVAVIGAQKMPEEVKTQKGSDNETKSKNVIITTDKREAPKVAHGRSYHSQGQSTATSPEVLQQLNGSAVETKNAGPQQQQFLQGQSSIDLNLVDEDKNSVAIQKPIPNSSDPSSSPYAKLGGGEGQQQQPVPPSVLMPLGQYQQSQQYQLEPTAAQQQQQQLMMVPAGQGTQFPFSSSTDSLQQQQLQFLPVSTLSAPTLAAQQQQSQIQFSQQQNVGFGFPQPPQTLLEEQRRQEEELGGTAKPGESCARGQVCIGGAICRRSLCICGPGEAIIGDRCVNREGLALQSPERINSAEPGQPCFHGVHCNGGAICKSNICICPDETYLFRGECLGRVSRSKHFWRHAPLFSPNAAVMEVMRDDGENAIGAIEDPAPTRTVSPGAMCRISLECPYRTECIRGVCRCEKGETIVNGICRKSIYQVPPGGRCDTQRGLDCIGESHCFYGICVCLYGLVNIGNECASAEILRKSTIGESCALGQLCDGKGECRDGICQCPGDTHFDSSSKRCINPVSTYQGGRADFESLPQPEYVELPVTSGHQELVGIHLGGDGNGNGSAIPRVQIYSLPRSRFPSSTSSSSLPTDEGRFNQILTANQMSINVLDQDTLRALLGGTSRFLSQQLPRLGESCDSPQNDDNERTFNKQGEKCAGSAKCIRSVCRCPEGHVKHHDGSCRSVQKQQKDPPEAYGGDGKRGETENVEKIQSSLSNHQQHSSGNGAGTSSMSLQNYFARLESGNNYNGQQNFPPKSLIAQNNKPSSSPSPTFSTASALPSSSSRSTRGSPGTPCTASGKCSGGSVCISDLCVCRPGYRPQAGYCQIAKVPLGGNCFFSEQCAGNGFCINGQCACKSSASSEAEFGSARSVARMIMFRHRCPSRPLAHAGEDCTHQQACSWNSVCGTFSGVCECPSGMESRSGGCFPARRVRGAECANSGHCHQKGYCDNGYCICKAANLLPGNVCFLPPAKEAAFGGGMDGNWMKQQLLNSLKANTPHPRVDRDTTEAENANNNDAYGEGEDPERDEYLEAAEGLMQQSQPQMEGLPGVFKRHQWQPPSSTWSQWSATNGGGQTHRPFPGIPISGSSRRGAYIHQTYSQQQQQQSQPRQQPQQQQKQFGREGTGTPSAVSAWYQLNMRKGSNQQQRQFFGNSGAMRNGRNGYGRQQQQNQNTHPVPHQYSLSQSPYGQMGGRNGAEKKSQTYNANNANNKNIFGGMNFNNGKKDFSGTAFTATQQGMSGTSFNSGQSAIGPTAFGGQNPGIGERTFGGQNSLAPFPSSQPQIAQPSAASFPLFPSTVNLNSFYGTAGNSINSQQPIMPQQPFIYGGSNSLSSELPQIQQPQNSYNLFGNANEYNNNLGSGFQLTPFPVQPQVQNMVEVEQEQPQNTVNMPFVLPQPEPQQTLFVLPQPQEQTTTAAPPMNLEQYLAEVGKQQQNSDLLGGQEGGQQQKPGMAMPGEYCNRDRLCVGNSHCAAGWCQCGEGVRIEKGGICAIQTNPSSQSANDDKHQQSARSASLKVQHSPQKGPIQHQQPIAAPRKPNESCGLPPHRCVEGAFCVKSQTSDVVQRFGPYCKCLTNRINQNGVCVKHNSGEEEEKTQPVLIPVGKQCTEDDICEAGAQCGLDGICVCRNGQEFQMGLCMKIAQPGESCSNGEFCTESAVCISSILTCVCPVGMVVRGGGKCEPEAKGGNFSKLPTWWPPSNSGTAEQQHNFARRNSAFGAGGVGFGTNSGTNPQHPLLNWPPHWHSQQHSGTGTNNGLLSVFYPTTTPVPAPTTTTWVYKAALGQECGANDDCASGECSEQGRCACPQGTEEVYGQCINTRIIRHPGEHCVVSEHVCVGQSWCKESVCECFDRKIVDANGKCVDRRRRNLMWQKLAEFHHYHHRARKPAKGDSDSHSFPTLIDDDYQIRHPFELEYEDNYYPPSSAIQGSPQDTFQNPNRRGPMPSLPFSTAPKPVQPPPPLLKKFVPILCGVDLDCPTGSNCIGTKCQCNRLTIVIEQDLSSMRAGMNNWRYGQCVRSEDCPAPLSCVNQRCSCVHQKVTPSVQKKKGKANQQMQFRSMKRGPQATLETAKNGAPREEKKLKKTPPSAFPPSTTQKTRHQNYRPPRERIANNKSPRTSEKPPQFALPSPSYEDDYQENRGNYIDGDEEFIGIDSVELRSRPFVQDVAVGGGVQTGGDNARVSDRFGSSETGAARPRQWNLPSGGIDEDELEGAILPGALCDAFSSCGPGAECLLGRCQCIYRGQKLAFVNGTTLCVDRDDNYGFERETTNIAALSPPEFVFGTGSEDNENGVWALPEAKFEGTFAEEEKENKTALKKSKSIAPSIHLPSSFSIVPGRYGSNRLPPASPGNKFFRQRIVLPKDNIAYEHNDDVTDHKNSLKNKTKTNSTTEKRRMERRYSAKINERTNSAKFLEKSTKNSTKTSMD